MICRANGCGADVEDVSLLPENLRRVVGIYGIARSVRTILNAPGEPRLHSVASIPNETARTLGADFAGHTGAIGETWVEAATGAVGELVERYCSTAQSSLLYSSKQDLPARGYSMQDLGVYSKAQYMSERFPFRMLADDEETTWVAGRDMNDGSQVFVPACMVYIPYVPQYEDRRDWGGFAVSTGQACHSDIERARLLGLCEAIERDAFMITWLRALPATEIHYQEDPVVASWFDRYLAVDSLDFHLFRLANDVQVPTMLCIVRGESPQGPFACVGCATRPTEREAAKKALIEGAQGAVWVRDLIDSKPDWTPDPDYRNLLDFEDHVRLYGIPSVLKNLDFLYTGGEDILDDAEPIKNPSETVAHLLRALRDVGIGALEVDLTTSDVREMGSRVVKVILPGTSQLQSVHAIPALGSPRLNTMPTAVGLRDIDDRTLNTNPHPFP